MAVVVLSNVENLSAGNIARDVMAITYGRPYQMPIERTATPVKPETLAQYVGRYQIAPDFGNDADGKVTHVTQHKGGQDRKASKVP